jgi:uncharacterized protein DUF87
MLITSFIANLFGFMFGSSLFVFLLSLLFYIMLFRYVLLPTMRLLSPLIFSLMRLRTAQQQPFRLLRLTPPPTTDTSPLASVELLSSLHHILHGGRWYERLLSGSDRASLELVSTKQDGIRYLLRVSESKIEVVQTMLHSYLPDLQITEASDYLPTSSSTQVAQFTQAGHFAYSLTTAPTVAAHDLAGYLTGAMTKLKADELMALQIVIEPSFSAGIIRLRNRVQAGVSVQLHSFWTSPLRAMRWLLQESLGLAGLGSVGNSRPSYIAGQDIQTEIVAKLSQPLFRADIRALLLFPDDKRTEQRLDILQSSLAVYSRPGYQALRLRSSFGFRFTRAYRLFQYQQRLLSLLPSDSSLFSCSELAGLYHFPYGEALKTENVPRLHARTLPAPLSLKNDQTLDVIFGQNRYHDVITPIGLTQAERQRHVYLLGGTGNGKSTLLQTAIVSDMKQGKGLAIIDPHGDLATTLLGYVPRSRIKDVVYFNPRDYDYPIGLNLLELPDHLTGSELAHEKDMVTEAVISVLRRIFDDNTDISAYRIERILRNSIHTALTIEGATLFTVLRLLSDKAYQREIAHNLTDVSLKRFWVEEMSKAGDMQRVKLSGGPITRIERFERSESARRVLGQAHSTINFDELLYTGKILICNFSKGHLGEDTSALFGTTVMAMLQLAAWRRQDIAPDKRQPFYVYVDEFQNFANDAFASLLTEARKYKLYLTIAEQSTAQQDERLVEVMLNNVGTVICFRTGSPRDERLMLHQFGPFIEHGELANLPAYQFYIRIAAQTVSEPFSGETILPSQPGAESIAAAVMRSSRDQFATQAAAREEETPALIHSKAIPTMTASSKIKINLAAKTTRP